MDRRRLRSKCRGALLGAAVGDALGAPFEGAGFVDGATLLRLEREPGPMRYTTAAVPPSMLMATPVR